MPGAYAALVASALLGASSARYEAGGTVQATYGTDWEAFAPAVGTQLELVPRLALSFAAKGVALRLNYYPQILMSFSAATPTVLHRLALSVELRPARTVKLGALINASYGTNNFRAQSVRLPPASGTSSGPAPGTSGGTDTPATGSGAGSPAPTTLPPPAPVQSVPLISTVTYLDAGASLGLEIAFSATVGMNTSFSYVARGGADAPSRVAVPVQRGPSGSIGIDWRPRKEHRLGTSLSATYYSFLSEPPAVLVQDSWTSQLLEAWEYTYVPHHTLRLGLGVGTSGNAANFASVVSRQLVPVAEGSLVLGGELRLGARYGPSIDFTTGLSAQRVEASIGFASPLGRAWDLNANVVAAEVVTGPQREQFMGTGQVVASFRPVRQLRVFTGLLAIWQRPGPFYPGATVRQVSLAVGVDFDEVGQL
jgi:hypothetical protein